jgi:hypothetical protein
MCLSRISIKTVYLAAVAAAVAAAFAFPAPSSAYTSTTADATGDSNGAPDLTGLTVTYDNADADALIVKISQAGALADGSDVMIGFDTDLNPATGSDGGADYLLDVAPATGGEISAAFSRWQSGQYVAFSPVEPVIAAAEDGSEEIVMCLCDLKDPLSFGIFARSELAGATDLLPETGTATVQIPVLRSVLYSLRPPSAGSTFSVVVTGARLYSDQTHIVRPQSSTCSATLGGKPVALSGRCRWRLPADARHRKLVLTIGVLYEGTKTTFSRAYTVG